MTKHPMWQGHWRQHQVRARILHADETGRELRPWTWITLECGHNMCLNPGHMRVHQPRVIAYRPGTCVYCGEGSTGVDHLLPEPWTGLAERNMVAVVPACANCNGRIGDHPSPNVSVRRKVAQLSIERNAKGLLLRPRKTESEMAGLGYAMRSVAEKNNIKVDRVKARLGWPGHDIFYDLRAFQKAGIDDPITLELCDEISTPLRPEYHEEAA